MSRSRSLLALAVTSVVAAAWIACVGDEPDTAEPGSGAEGAPCANGQCLTGLSCVSDRCVRLDGSTSSSSSSSSSSGGSLVDGSAPDADAGPVSVARLAAGQTNDCVLLSDGTVKCWGDNQTFELARKTTTQLCGGVACSWDPVTIEGLGKARQVGVGEGFACALVDGDDPVKCWGSNSDGQLGHPSSEDLDQCVDFRGIKVKCNATPSAVAGLRGTVVTNLGVGNRHACVVLNTKKVLCWGNNSAGQLGQLNDPDGGMELSPAPVEVTDPGVTYLSVVPSGAGPSADREGHTCGTTAGNAVRCWGTNARGALGRGDAGPFDPHPGNVLDGLGAALGPISLVAAADQTSCALGQDNHLSCWGGGQYGLIGSDAGDSPAARPVAQETEFKYLSGSHFHMCALEKSGAVWCWGLNGAGQLGDGHIGDNEACTIAPCRATPKPVPSFDAEDISVGLNTIARRADGSVWSWGTNRFGLLGHDPTTDKDKACDFGSPCSVVPGKIPSLP